MSIYESQGYVPSYHGQMRGGARLAMRAMQNPAVRRGAQAAVESMFRGAKRMFSRMSASQREGGNLRKKARVFRTPPSSFRGTFRVPQRAALANRRYVKRRLRRPRNKRSRKSSIYDALAPRIQEDFRDTGTQIDGNANVQTVVTYTYLSKARIEDIISKTADAGHIQEHSFVYINEEYRRLWIENGRQNHTFVNSSNHACRMLLVECTPRRNTRMSPEECWEKDLLLDNVNKDLQEPTTATGLVEATKTTLFCFPDANGFNMKRNWYLRTVGKVNLDPGEKTSYTLRIAKRTLNEADMRDDIADTGAGYPQFIRGVSKCLLVITMGQIVTSAASDGVTHGSHHVAHMQREVTTFRAPIFFKPMQRYIHGDFGTIVNTADEQRINQETDDVGAGYTEL